MRAGAGRDHALACGACGVRAGDRRRRGSPGARRGAQCRRPGRSRSRRLPHPGRHGRLRPDVRREDFGRPSTSRTRSSCSCAATTCARAPHSTLPRSPSWSPRSLPAPNAGFIRWTLGCLPGLPPRRIVCQPGLGGKRCTCLAGQGNARPSGGHFGGAPPRPPSSHPDVSGSRATWVVHHPSTDRPGQRAHGRHEPGRRPPRPFPRQALPGKRCRCLAGQGNARPSGGHLGGAPLRPPSSHPNVSGSRATWVVHHPSTDRPGQRAHGRHEPGRRPPRPFPGQALPSKRCSCLACQGNARPSGSHFGGAPLRPPSSHPDVSGSRATWVVHHPSTDRRPSACTVTMGRAGARHVLSRQAWVAKRCTCLAHHPSTDRRASHARSE